MSPREERDYLFATSSRAIASSRFGNPWAQRLYAGLLEDRMHRSAEKVEAVVAAHDTSVRRVAVVVDGVAVSSPVVHDDA